MTKSSPLSSSVNKLPNGSIEITFTIPWINVQKGYEHEVVKAVAETELPGFRKGKAPKNEVEAKLDKSKLYSHALEHLVPEEYTKAVEEQHLKPVLYPSITVKEGQEGKDWIFVATTCEAPTANQIPELLIESETNHRLVALAENLSRLDITMDKYLVSKKLTPESLKTKLAIEIRQDIMKT